MLTKHSHLVSCALKLVCVSMMAACFTSCACTDNRKPQVKSEPPKQPKEEIAENEVLATPPKKIEQAQASVSGTSDQKIQGVVTFNRVEGGIQIIADVYGLTPGKHGFHVHEHGDCSGGDGMKAGGHFNPTNSRHGGPDSPERHVGDLGNLEADVSGHAHYERVDTLIALEGPHSIIGRSVIVHEGADDLVSQPTGNSGARIACGVVEAVK